MIDQVGIFCQILEIKSNFEEINHCMTTFRQKFGLSSATNWCKWFADKKKYCDYKCVLFDIQFQSSKKRQPGEDSSKQLSFWHTCSFMSCVLMTFWRHYVRSWGVSSRLMTVHRLALHFLSLFMWQHWHHECLKIQSNLSLKNHLIIFMSKWSGM